MSRQVDDTLKIKIRSSVGESVADSCIRPQGAAKINTPARNFTVDGAEKNLERLGKETARATTNTLLRATTDDSGSSTAALHEVEGFAQGTTSAARRAQGAGTKLLHLGRQARIAQGTKRTLKEAQRASRKAARATANGIRNTARAVNTTITAIKTMAASPALAQGAAVVLVFFVIAYAAALAVSSVTSIIPSISLTSKSQEITNTYLWITQLDVDKQLGIMSIEDQLPDPGARVDYYHNNKPVAREDIRIVTDADRFLIYLEAKHGNYTFDGIILGLFGTKVKDEVTAIHNLLHTVEVVETKKIVQSTPPPEPGPQPEPEPAPPSQPRPPTDPLDHWGNPLPDPSPEPEPPPEGGGEEEEEAPAQQGSLVKVTEVWITSQDFTEFIHANAEFLDEDDYDRFTAMVQAGAYIIFKDLGSPFRTYHQETGFEWTQSVTSRFGWRIHPISGAKAPHLGLDIGAPNGTPINNVLSGIVTFAGQKEGFGNTVEVTCLKGKEQVLYAHLSEIHVTAGQEINRGEIIGRVGSTGQATGAHLHIEYRRSDNSRNPAMYLEER